MQMEDMFPTIDVSVMIHSVLAMRGVGRIEKDNNPGMTWDCTRDYDLGQRASVIYALLNALASQLITQEELDDAILDLEEFYQLQAEARSNLD